MDKIKDTILKVKNIMCSGCENTIMETFKNVDGIIEIKPSAKTKSVYVKYNEEKIKISYIIELLKKIGKEVE